MELWGFEFWFAIGLLFMGLILEGIIDVWRDSINRRQERHERRLQDQRRFRRLRASTHTS